MSCNLWKFQNTVKWLDSSPPKLEKSYFNFVLNVFLWKKLKARSYLRVIGVAEKVAQGARALLFETPPATKIYQKNLVSSFSVYFSIFAYNSTRVQQ